jgi:ABC-type nitrate/sulfonate/bicarbonate transport system ATPase subunit
MVTHDLDTLFELSTRIAVLADQARHRRWRRRAR